MKERTFAILMLCALFYLLPPEIASVYAQDKESDSQDSFYSKLQITGQNTMRFDYFNTHGDKSATPYRFGGGHFYDDIQLNFSRQTEPFDSWRAQVYALYNNSEYRRTEDGVFLERINIFREKGSAYMPYRFEAGDIYGFFSLRTLQRSLKGVQFELQPSNRRDTKQSVMLVAGTNQPSWDDFSKRESYTAGVSYLILNKSLGRYSFNAVSNNVKANQPSATNDRANYVYSLAGEQNIRVAGNDIKFEEEIGYFTGKNISNPDTEADDTGIYLQMTGRANYPVNYRVRYERYGKDFKPESASVASDRQSVEGHLGYNFESGLSLRGRIQHFKDQMESVNPVDTVTYGVNLSGPVFASLVKNMNASVDAFTQTVSNKDKTTDYVNQNINVNINTPIIERLTANLGVNYQKTDNKVANSSDSSTTQLNLNTVYQIQGEILKGSVGPGVVYRTMSNNGGKDILPTVFLSLNYARHSLAYNLSYNKLDRNTPTADMKNLSNNLSYRYTAEKNIVGLELNSEYRNPTSGGSTTAYKVGLFWTHNFDKPAAKPKEETKLAMAPPSVGLVTFDITEILPGIDVYVAREKLYTAGIRGYFEQDGILVYEKRIFEDINQRQRLALVYDRDNGKVKKTAVIVNLKDVGNQEDLMQTFEQVKNIMLTKYGRPSNFYEQGTIDQNVFQNIGNGSLIRLYEWKKKEGTVRLGMPRRLDGEVRIEIQFARDFPSINDTLWSIEEIK